MRSFPATNVIAALANAQHGVVARWQLRALGLSNTAISRSAAGRLHRLHHGVYAVGHSVLTREGRWMAAVLAAGTDAVLSHITAGGAWALRPLGAGLIHVTVPGDSGRKRRPGIRIHRSRTLTPQDTTTHLGIPITTPLRTIIDLASTLEPLALEQALDQADRRGLIDFAELKTRPIPRSLQAVLSRYTPAPPSPAANSRTASSPSATTTTSRARSATPSSKAKKSTSPGANRRLIVEVDGYGYHRSPSRFENDRERDVMLTIAGWHVMRFTWTQVTTRPNWVAEAVRARAARLGGLPAPSARRS